MKKLFKPVLTYHSAGRGRPNKFFQAVLQIVIFRYLREAKIPKLLGHKGLTMTLRYSHLAPQHVVKAVDILDSTLNKNQLYKNFTILAAVNV